MTREWKPGDRAMVEIKSLVPGAEYAEVSFPGAAAGYIIDVPVGFLSPLPPAMTAEDRAVIEAADAWRELRNAGRRAYDSCAIKLIDAIDARAAKLAPPDPVEELKAAHGALLAEYRAWKSSDLECRSAEKDHTAAIDAMAKAETRWNNALAAVEAARGKAP